jgi:hypothetical protein
MKYYTFRKVADHAKRLGQHVRFRAGKGYYIVGKAIGAKLQFTMFDSVNINEIPRSAVAVAGYTSGNWPTFLRLKAQFPKAKLLSIAVNASHDAMCLDVEPGDATNDQASAWVKRQQGRGVKRPVLYTSVSNAASLLHELERHGIKRSDIRLWTAHYTFRAHRCGPECGFGFTGKADATQYDDKALGKNLDASLCAGDFL